MAGFFNGLFCRSRTEGDPNSLEEEDNSDDFRQYPPFFNGVSISFLPRFKEMKRRHDIKTGKIVPGAKRYHRVRRRLVDLDDVQDEYFGEDDGKDLPPRPGSDGANAW